MTGDFWVGTCEDHNAEMRIQSHSMAFIERETRLQSLPELIQGGSVVLPSISMILPIGGEF